jgi:hypothetical protein
MRTNLSAAALLVALLATMGAPLFAAEASHEDCAQQPHCRDLARLTQGCCYNARDISNQPGVAESRFDVAADRSAVWILPATIEPPPGSLRSRSVDTSPRHGPSPGLPILLADLRL